MKHLFRRTGSLWLAIPIVIAMLWLSACQPDTLPDLVEFASGSGGSNPGPGASIITSACEYSLHADVETYSFRRKADGASGQLSLFDSISGVPLVQRMDIQVCSDLDGQSEWLIEKLDPTVNIPFDHQTAPDTSAQFHYAWLSGETLQIYDDAGNQMHEEDFVLSGFAQLMSLGAGTRSALFQQGLAQAQAEGTVVAELPGEYIAIRRTDPQSGEQTVILLDLQQELLIGTTLYDAQGEIKLRVIFEYESGGENPLLESMHLAAFEPSFTSGVDMVHETHLYFHEFSWQKNL